MLPKYAVHAGQDRERLFQTYQEAAEYARSVTRPGDDAFITRLTLSTEDIAELDYQEHSGQPGTWNPRP